MDALTAFDWPGNIRQLQNFVQRMVILKGDGVLDLEDLPSALTGERALAPASADVVFPEDGIDFNTRVSDFEDRLILSALRITGGNKNRAAQLLRLNRTTLVEKIKKKKLETCAATEPPPNDVKRTAGAPRM
jgi:DNA-binding NtrC family response regulator